MEAEVGQSHDRNVSEMDGAWCARYAAEVCGELGVLLTVTDAAVVVLANAAEEEDEADEAKAEGDE